MNNQVDLLVALGEGRFPDVVGTAETDEIEFKESPYQLETARQKWELAKDVAALANARGGILVIGFRTRKDPNAISDTAVEHRPVRKALVNWEAYRKIISAHIRPLIADLTPRWYPPAAEEDDGVFVLSIPPQAEAMKYFVVTEMVGADGKFPGSLGIPIRQGDLIDWMTAETLNGLIRDGRWERTQRGGLPHRTTAESPASVVAQKVEREALIASGKTRVASRCSDIETAAGWSEIPFLALHGIPSPTWDRPEDFYSTEGLRGRIESPNVLRPNGFHVETYATPEELGDGSLRCLTNRKALWLSPDGFVTAAARADGEYLGWYFNQDRPSGREPLALNPRVLSEYFLEFCRFVEIELEPRSNSDWLFWLSIVGFDRDGGVVLVPSLGAEGLLSSNWYGFHHDAKKPRAAGGAIPLPALPASSGKNGYRLMTELYAFFGLPPTDIPYSVDKEIRADLIVDSNKTLR